MLDKNCTKNQQVSILKKETIELINNELGMHLTIKEDNIKLSPEKIEHIKDDHPYEFEHHFDKIKDIIDSPNYIAVHPNGKSIEFIKEFDTKLLVAVRIKPVGPYWVKSLYKIEDFKLEQYKESGTVIVIKK